MVLWDMLCHTHAGYNEHVPIVELLRLGTWTRKRGIEKLGENGERWLAVGGE